jgi:peptidoglycan/xylan/chitin deacetylase (PgdA/CDA1 family)
MKKTTGFFLITLFFSLAVIGQVLAASSNLISNPSVENSKNGTPTSWSTSRNGTNTTTFTYQKNGYDGTKSLYINVKSLKSGSAKWFFKAVTAQPGTKYSYSEFYKSNTNTGIYLETANKSGTKTATLLTTVPAASSWTSVNLEFTTPSSASTMTVYHLINSVGNLQTDFFSLTLSTSPGTIPPNTAPLPPTSSPPIPPSTSPPEPPIIIPIPPTTSPPEPPIIIPIPPTTSPPVDQIGNLIQNFSLETVSDSSSKLPKYWVSEKYGTNTVTFLYPASAHTGSTGARIDVSQYTSGDAKWLHNEIAVLPNTDYKFEDYYKSNVATEVNAEFHMADGSVQYKNLGMVQPSVIWTKFSVVFTTPANVKSVIVFHLIDKVGYLENDDFFLGPYSTSPSDTFERPLISITFDDGFMSQYTNAFTTLKKYGLNGTFYIVTNYLGTSPYMTKNNMIEVSSAGNEIGSHTINHVHMPILTDSALDLELSFSQSFLQGILGKPVINIASPFGEYSTTVLTAIKKYYVSHRSTEAGYNTKSNLDLYNVKVQNVRANVTTATVKSWIDKAINDKSWLVLTYHRVETSNADLYNTIPQDIDDQLSYIKQSGVTVKTINDAINEVLPQIGK